MNCVFWTKLRKLCSFWILTSVRFGSVFRKPIFDILIGFRTPLEKRDITVRRQHQSTVSAVESRLRCTNSTGSMQSGCRSRTAPRYPDRLSMTPWSCPTPGRGPWPCHHSPASRHPHPWPPGPSCRGRRHGNCQFRHQNRRPSQRSPGGRSVPTHRKRSTANCTARFCCYKKVTCDILSLVQRLQTPTENISLWTDRSTGHCDFSSVWAIEIFLLTYLLT